MHYMLYGLVYRLYATLHLDFYIVSTIVWICIDYCMDLIRVLYGFVSNIIGICIDVYMNYICHCIFDWGYIYAIY